MVTLELIRITGGDLENIVKVQLSLDGNEIVAVALEDVYKLAYDYDVEDLDVYTTGLLLCAAGDKIELTPLEQRDAQETWIMKFTRELLTQNEREQIEFYIFSRNFIQLRIIQKGHTESLKEASNYAAHMACDVINSAMARSK